MEIAAAGGHNLMLRGATRDRQDDARASAAVDPAADDPGRGAGGDARAQRGRTAQRRAASPTRPFRAPHHTISAAGLVGGGNPPRPGEASLANRGILFLDELSEFQRSTVEALRQPLEDGRVTIVRGQRALVFPTRFMLVGATNPCPCGYAGVGDRCTCSEVDIRRHERRLSGPLLDRMDMHVDVQRPTEEDLLRRADHGLGGGTRAGDRGARAAATSPRGDIGELQRRTRRRTDPVAGPAR